MTRGQTWCLNLNLLQSKYMLKPSSNEGELSVCLSPLLIPWSALEFFSFTQNHHVLFIRRIKIFRLMNLKLKYISYSALTWDPFLSHQIHQSGP